MSLLRPLPQAKGDAFHEKEAGFDFDQFLAVARRQWKIAAVCVIVALLLGLSYLLTAVPKYTSSIELMIDMNNKQIVDQLSLVSGVADDEGSILSQVELLKSERMALAVVNSLDLSNNRAFIQSETSPFQSALDLFKALVDFRRWFSSDIADSSTDALQQRAAYVLSKNLDVTRVGRTYVLNLSYKSPDRSIAARIAKQFGEAYLDDQLNSKYEATRRAGDWLQQRIAELKQKSLDTDLAVQKFKQDHQLISTDGSLLSDQQLTQLNAQLIIAQSNLANASAKYSSIKSIIDSGQIDSAVTDSLDNRVISSLREKYFEASKLESDITRRLGSDHIRAQQLRGDMNEYQKLIFSELGRIAQSYNVEANVAQDRVSNLTQQVSEATHVSITANDALVQLRELQREAETYKNLYQSFLQKYQESVQQQSFPVTEARIISNAVAPNRPSEPKKALVLALSVALGLILGSGVGAFREYRDRFFRIPAQIRDDLDVEPLGMVPLVADELAATEADIDKVHPRAIIMYKAISNYVVKNPLSSFAETLRSSKIAIDLVCGEKKTKIVGIVSALPGEGKSTISVNLAELLANQGARTLLIDGDLRNPGATRQLTTNASQGIVEVIRDRLPIKDALLFDRQTKLAFLPAVVKHRIPYSAELISSPEMDEILRQSSENFDYIIIDLPPLGPVVDARAIAHKIDVFVLVVEWGKTSRQAVRSELERSSVVTEKCVGAILNKVDGSKSKLYESYGSIEYYADRYRSYYREDA